MISFFPKPVSAVTDGSPVLILGLNENGVLLVLPDGTLGMANYSDVQLDWRYDPDAHAWIDLSLDYGDDDDEPDQEASDDGSAEIPGDLPDAD